VNAVLEQHPVAARVLLLMFLFASRSVEAVIRKARALACTTWFSA